MHYAQNFSTGTAIGSYRQTNSSKLGEENPITIIIIIITRLPYTCLSAACSTSEVCLSELLMAAAVSAADAAKLEAAGE